MITLLIAFSLTVLSAVNIHAQNNRLINQVSSVSERAETKDFYITDDNNRMYFETYGSAKDAILFVHGWSVNCRMWDDQIDFFKDRFKVILIDLVGFGKSEHNRQNWSMQHYGTDIAGLCKKLDLKNVYLVGWSMGTSIVVEAARNLGNDAKAVILVDGLNQMDYALDSLGVESWVNYQVSGYKNFKSWHNYLIGDTKVKTSDSLLIEKLLSLMPADEKMPDWWKPSPKLYSKWVALNLKATVSELKIPIRAINASNQETYVEQWQSFYKDYRAVIFENSHHHLTWEYPQKFNETLLRIIDEISR